MEVTIIYLSQTGNTRKVAEAIAHAFQETGHSVQTLSLSKANAEGVAKTDLLGVGTPSLYSQAPYPVKEFLRRLPGLDNQRSFVFATTGGAPGRVLHDIARLLRSKGADVMGGFLVRGEVHHPAPCMIGRFPGRPNAEDLAEAKRFATALAERALSSPSGPPGKSQSGALKPKWGFYQLIGSMSSNRLLRFMLPASRPAPIQCDECEWCVHECPVNNITLQPYPVLGNGCIRCYRCLTGCPQKAFKADWRFGNLVALSLYNTTFVRWFGDTEPGEQIYQSADRIGKT